MKIIKKANKKRGYCHTCGTTYSLSPKDFRQTKLCFLGKRWLMCKLCKQCDVEVISYD